MVAETSVNYRSSHFRCLNVIARNQYLVKLKYAIGAKYLPEFYQFLFLYLHKNHKSTEGLQEETTGRMEIHSNLVAIKNKKQTKESLHSIQGKNFHAHKGGYLLTHH